MGKGVAGIYDGMTEGESLALVYSYCPCQAHGKLLKTSLHLLVYLHRLLVERVSGIVPMFALHPDFAVEVLTMHNEALLVDTDNLANHTIEVAPLARVVVLDEHHLRTLFQGQRLLCWVVVLGKVARYLCPIGKGGRIQFVQFSVVDALCQHIVCGEADVTRRGRRCEIRYVALVQLLKRGGICPVGTNVVEQGKEVLVRLSVCLFQFHGGIVRLAQCPAAEEERRVVVLREHVPLLGFHHRCQLLQVAYHQQLHSAERQMGLTETPQYGIYGIQYVGTHHTYLINDKQVEATNQPLLLLAELVSVHILLGTEGRVGHIGSKRQLEERMQGHATGIDGGNTRWGSQHHTLWRTLLEVLQKGRLASTRLARKEKVCAGVLYDATRKVKFGVAAHQCASCLVSFVKLWICTDAWRPSSYRHGQRPESAGCPHTTIQPLRHRPIPARAWDFLLWPDMLCPRCVLADRGQHGYRHPPEGFPSPSALSPP